MNVYDNGYLTMYFQQGWAAIPVKLRSKKPLIKNWQDAKPQDAFGFFERFSEETNIGVVLGNASGGLVDVDLDHPDAAQFATLLLPKTEFVFGRRSKPQSHRIFKVPTVDRTRQFKNPSTGGMIVELRGKGGFTIFPGSIHESGEAIQFEPMIGDPGKADYSLLLTACAVVAVATVLAPEWNPGTRHVLALGVSALFASAGIGEDDCRRFIKAMVTVKQDCEANDRLTAVHDTYERFRRGQPIEFRETLTQALGQQIVQAITGWLRLGDFQGAAKPVFDLHELGTDVRAAHAFAEANRDKLIFADLGRQWLMANTGVHERCSEDRVKGAAIEFVKEAVSVVSAQYQLPAVRNLLSAGRMKAMIDLSRSQLRIDRGEFDSDPWIVGCHGGVLDLRERCLVEPKTIVTQRLGTRFDPVATCPQFEGFIGRVFDSNQDVIKFFQRAFGYSLSGRTSDQCLFLLVGSGANGKSTVIRVMQRLLSDYAGTIPMHTLVQTRHGSERTDDLAALKSKRFVAAQEGEDTDRLAEAKIKLMTGGDIISCRRLYGAYEEYVPQFKVWIATNNLPQIKGTGDAIWRRIHTIRFPVTIPVEERDPQLYEKLTAELPGILNWALQGFADWNEKGLNPPRGVNEATAEYRRDSDTVCQFVEVCCFRQADGITSAQALFGAYTSWCDQSGIEPVKVGQFGKELTRLGFEVRKGRSGNSRRGIQLVMDPTPR